MSGFKRWVLFPVMTVLLCFIVLELAMILLEPVLFRGFYMYDRDMGFRVRPYIDGTNRFGFNDKDYPLAKAPGTFRILVVGDSFAWAGGRDGNYTAMLEDRFEADYRTQRIEVINSGYPGTHTAEQLAMLKKFGLQYDPDLVILGFFVGNDFYDANPNRKRIVINGTHFDVDRRNQMDLFGIPVLARSRLIEFIRQKGRVVTELTNARQQSEAKAAENPPSFSENIYLELEYRRMSMFNRSLHTQGIFKERIVFILSSIFEMRQLLDEKNIPLLIAIYPDEFQVNDKLRQTIFQRYNLDPADYDMELVQDLLKRYLDQQHIAYLDLLKPFQTRGKSQSLYLLRNTHWNEAGNRLAADALFDHLTRDRWVQDRRR